MGAHKGTVTVRRYVVRGEPPRERARIMKGVRAHTFVPIDPAGQVERSIGWACAQDTDDEATSENSFLGDALVLALRVDTLKPPASLVKRLVAQKLKALGKKPGRREKQAAKDEVVKTLRGRAFPSTRSYDVVWQLQEGRVFFWSHAKGANELLADLFAKSFGLELVPHGPGIVAGRVARGVEPTPELMIGFAGLPGRIADGEDTDDVA
jgi:DNA recombination-dependent growth factor C